VLTFNKNFFYTLLGFQIVWISCVSGEYYDIPLLGVFFGIIYFIIFFYFNKNKKKVLQICTLFSLIGYLFDSILSYNKIYFINSNLTIGYLPIWFLVLWPCFITLFVEILFFLKKSLLLSFFIGAILVPPTYYFGIVIGISQSNNILLSFLIMILFWGLFLVFYSLYLRFYYKTL